MAVWGDSQRRRYGCADRQPASRLRVWPSAVAAEYHGDQCEIRIWTHTQQLAERDIPAASRRPFRRGADLPQPASDDRQAVRTVAARELQAPAAGPAPGGAP